MRSLVQAAALLTATIVAQPLPRLQISRDVSVSGISSGADMAVLLQVAYSDLFVGSGIFAGQAYSCSVMRFPTEPLTTCAQQPASMQGPGCVGENPAPCIGCPAGYTVGYDHCKVPAEPSGPGWTQLPLLWQLAANYSASGLIADTAYLRSARVYLYRGTKDSVYLDGSVNNTAGFFANYVWNPSSQLSFEASIPSAHCMPTVDPAIATSTCGTGAGGPPAIENCGYDGAGAALQHIYSGSLTQPSSAVPDLTYLLPFDQTPFFGAQWPNMGTEGYIYIPPACTSGSSTCKLHVALHGCGMSVYNPAMGANFTQHAGYLPWAAANNMVVLFPQGGGYTQRNATAPSAQMQAGCYDGYGQLGPDFAQRSGAQMLAIRNMITALTGF